MTKPRSPRPAIYTKAGTPPRAFLDGVPDLMLRIGPDDVLKDVRSDQRNLLFRDPAEVVGKTVDEIFPDPVGEMLKGTLDLARSSGTLRTCEFELQNGLNQLEYEARVVPILDSNELIVIARDISALKAAERELREQIRSKNQFLASVSHELRTPLTGVVGFTELIRDEGNDLSPRERTDMIESIAQQSFDLSNIVDDLLVAARAELGELTVLEVPIDLRAQAAQVVERWDPDTGCGITLVHDGSVAKATGDPARVRQIIRNLVDNAVKHGGPSVRVQTGSTPNACWLSVSDDGPGIDTDQFDRIFDPYHSSPSNSDGLSVGIGLSISRLLAKMMGGDLVLREADGWTKFELSLVRRQNQDVSG